MKANSKKVKEIKKKSKERNKKYRKVIGKRTKEKEVKKLIGKDLKSLRN